MGWISVENETPKLPNYDYCSVIVNTWTKGENRSVPMVYERAIVRGKRAERWKYCWNRIADKAPDFWMPMPKPPGQTTNADRIRAMTDEDLVSFLWEVFEAGIEDALYYQQGRKCSFEWTEDWLQQPVDETVL